MGNRTSFIKHVLVYGFGTVLLQASGFVLLPLYTRYLLPADFGILEVIERTGNFLALALLANGISTAAFSFYCQSEDPHEQSQVSATVTLTTLLGIFVGILFSWAASRPLAKFLTIDDWKLVVLGLSASLCQILPSVQLTLMQARTQSLRFVITSLLLMLTRVSLILVAMVYFELGVWGVLIGTIVTCVLGGLVLGIMEFRVSGFRPNGRTLFAILKFAWPFAPTGLLGFVLFNADRFFLLKSVGVAELGIYALAGKVAGIVGMASFAPLFKVWSAHLYRVYARPNAAEVVGKMFTNLLMPFVFTGLGISLFHCEIIQLLASKPYYEAAQWVPIMILANLFLSAQYLMDGAFYFRRQTTPKIVVTAIVTICSLGLYAWLIPLWQTAGAVLAMTGSMFLLAATTYLFSRRVFPVQYEWFRLLILLLTGVAFAIPGYYLGSGIWGVLLKSGIFFGWPALLFATGFFSPRELSIFKHGLQSAARFVHRVFSKG